MAGDWIKMRADLFTHPKVVRISSALKADTMRTVGGLMSAWCLFDAHSDDGKLSGYTPVVLDEHLRWDGFSSAMMAVGWLEFDGHETLCLPRFETHNGQSAKRRAQDADRKRSVRKTSASEEDKMRTREEKRREDIKQPRKASPAECEYFKAFYATYPRKEAKANAIKAWAKLTKDEQILACEGAVKYARAMSGKETQYIAMPASWINAKRWQDESLQSARVARQSLFAGVT